MNGKGFAFFHWAISTASFYHSVPSERGAGWKCRGCRAVWNSLNPRRKRRPKPMLRPSEHGEPRTTAGITFAQERKR